MGYLTTFAAYVSKLDRPKHAYFVSTFDDPILPSVDSRKIVRYSQSHLLHYIRLPINVYLTIINLLHPYGTARLM